MQIGSVAYEALQRPGRRSPSHSLVAHRWERDRRLVSSGAGRHHHCHRTDWHERAPRRRDNDTMFVVVNYLPHCYVFHTLSSTQSLAYEKTQWR